MGKYNTAEISHSQGAKVRGHLFPDESVEASEVDLFPEGKFWWWNTVFTNIQYTMGWCAGIECGRSWVWAPIWSNQDYKIGICCFYDKHASLRSKSKRLVGLESE